MLELITGRLVNGTDPKNRFSYNKKCILCDQI